MCFCSVEGMEQRGSQDDIYAHIGPPLVECAVKGINGCLLAYGQTGSGKTHTVMGGGTRGGSVDAQSPSALPGSKSDDDDGVLPRLLRTLFSTTQRESAASTESRTVSYRISARYFEVYNEKVFDLLQQKTPEITIKSIKTGLLRPGREELITSADAALQLLQEGDRRRTVAATLKNERSSRSHAIFQFICHRDVCSTQLNHEGDISSAQPVLSSTVSCVSLVDLAGSERQKQSGAEGLQFREMVNINLSLSTLRRVIQVLHDNAMRSASAAASGAQHAGVTVAPVRESVLTSILSPCFGGNSRTTMIINVSPSTADIADTVSTLEFGSVARRVVNEVSVNEDKNQAMLREMSDEITRLRQKLENRRASVRMSRRMSGILRQHAEELRLEAEQNRRSIGVSTVFCGPSAQGLFDVLPVETIERHDGDVDEDDFATCELHRNIAETTKRFESMQSEAAEHVQLCRRLQEQLEEKDVLVAALRHQVADLGGNFIDQVKKLLQSPPPMPASDNVVPLVQSVDEDASKKLGQQLRDEAIAHHAVVSHLTRNQEALYTEIEHLRRAHLSTVQQLAEMRNEMNALEDKEMVAAMQTKRMNELEEQCAHHMEERVALLMENHRLRLQVGGTGETEGFFASAAAATPAGSDEDAIAAGFVRDRCASTSGI
ncbi:kinesin, putative [Bodo saltans]|uniref:Kinesin, putative n=1 Tax=Bodo saltans TaxID=75058 RepID=A0A0S4J1I2_BODSA|nr:kinesin, putative [Bodo saltans]|eukprot:CUG10147.1 kinesin, putative [Bodo saltans]